MREYHTQAKVTKDKTVTIKGLPFKAGETVEVVVRVSEQDSEPHDRYPLRGTPILKYADPFEGVSEEDWEATS